MKKTRTDLYQIKNAVKETRTDLYCVKNAVKETRTDLYCVKNALEEARTLLEQADRGRRMMEQEVRYKYNFISLFGYFSKKS